ncbi:MAG: purine-nucleoside phosphorylase [Actinomycetes bacterium]|jgi:purine-nucleoside phosphorylase|nr:purine-nucleoside phosphorylase [Actinomycetes bacterium]
MFEQLRSSEQQLKSLLRGLPVPQVAVVLGSGLSAVAEAVDTQRVVPYADIEGFPTSTAPGHKGRFVFGTLAGVPLVVMQGRVHFYEGYAMSEVVLPHRLLARLGVQTFVLTNACGGIRSDMRPGDMVVLRDHLSSFVPSPLRGPNIEALGPRFPDMTEVYDAKLRAQLHVVAGRVGIALSEGVYLQVAGPAFETPAEIAAYRTLGADMTGMSTAVEAQALRHMGARVIGISCVTNLAAGMSGEPLSSEEVDEMGREFEPKLVALLSEALPVWTA